MNRNFLEKVLGRLSALGMFGFLSDKSYLSLVFWARMTKKINWKDPKSFNEKLQWLKLYDRCDKYVDLVDKLAVKEIVAEIIGNEFIIPTIGVFDKFEDINFDLLPDKFVMKCTHDSGGVVVVKDKCKFNKIDSKKFLEKSLRRNYYNYSREWPYKNVKPRILIEKFIDFNDSQEIPDYKFMCFNGTVKCSFVCTDRYSSDGLKVTFFDRNWDVMPFERHYPKSYVEIPKPENYEMMVELAEKLSKGIPFVRVDFYNVNGQIYFGELTFYPGSGFEEFSPEEWDYILGDWINLHDVQR